MKTKKLILIGLAAILFSIVATLAPPSAEAQDWDPLPGWTEPGVTMTTAMNEAYIKCLQIQAEQQFLLNMTPVPTKWEIVFVPGASVASAGMLGLFEVTLMISAWDELDCKNLLAEVSWQG